jgi:hypothetical protein
MLLAVEMVVGIQMDVLREMLPLDADAGMGTPPSMDNRSGRISGNK